MASVSISGDVSGAISIAAPSAAGSGVLTLPTGTDTLVGKATTDTLTNKTLVAPALGTPASGVLTNCTGVPAAALPAGSVLQVVNAIKTNTFSTTATNTWVDVTGLSVSITPRSTSSKILVSYCCSASAINGVNGALTQILRDATPIGIGTTATGSRINAGVGIFSGDNNWIVCMVQQVLDSPSTTSAITYKLQIRVGTASTGTVHVNRTINDNDNVYTGNYASSITVQEIQG